MALSKITSLLLLVGLGACAKVPTNNDEEILDKRQQRYAGMGSILGDEGIVFGGPKKNDGGGQGTGIGVNAYLWRATLDTLSFIVTPCR
jgi:hypothetical protein